MWKRILPLGALGIVTALGGGFAYLSLRTPNHLPAESIQVKMTPENIARGEYLCTVTADCDGCHSERDLSKFSAPVMARGQSTQKLTTLHYSVLPAGAGVGGGSNFLPSTNTIFTSVFSASQSPSVTNKLAIFPFSRLPNRSSTP